MPGLQVIVEGLHGLGRVFLLLREHVRLYEFRGLPYRLQPLLQLG